MASIERDHEREPRVVALLEDNVRAELRVTNAMLELGLSDTPIEPLMEGVTAGVLYTFSVDWSPDWAKPGQVHSWEKDGTSLLDALCVYSTLPHL